MNAIYTSSCLEVCNFRSISLYRFDYLLYPSFKFLTGTGPYCRVAGRVSPLTIL